MPEYPIVDEETNEVVNEVKINDDKLDETEKITVLTGFRVIGLH